MSILHFFNEIWYSKWSEPVPGSGFQQHPSCSRSMQFLESFQKLSKKSPKQALFLRGEGEGPS